MNGKETDLNERMREAAAMGNEDLIEELVKQGADVNSSNKMNGWTPLHWASRRTQVQAVRLLVQLGADPSIANDKEQLPNQLTNSEAIHAILGKPMMIAESVDDLPIVPNYIRHPPFPYSSPNGTSDASNHVNESSVQESHHRRSPDAADLRTVGYPLHRSQELVLKVRIARTRNTDFIEIELDRHRLTYQALVDKCCEELEVPIEDVVKVRKLPNTIVRKDKDVQRLGDFQEVELVVQKRSAAEAFNLQIQNMDLVY